MLPPARLDLRWPQSFATVVEKVVSEDVVSDILGQADVLAEHPNFWLPKVTFEAAAKPKVSSQLDTLLILHESRIPAGGDYGQHSAAYTSRESHQTSVQ